MHPTNTLFNETTSSQAKLVSLLSSSGLHVSCAESCTGGLIAAAITEVSGSSSVFECGICSYSNRIKHEVLGVRQETLDTYTELSLQTAEEMAAGVLKLSHSDIAVSTTGVAGPTGGTDENPVGTVYIAIANKSQILYSEKVNFNPDLTLSRDEIRKACTNYCLEKLCLAATAMTENL